MKNTKSFILALTVITALLPSVISAQRDLTTHTRGKLWETLMNFGFIGSPGAWDYQQVTGVGFYPGFPGYYFPNQEEEANDPTKVTNANFHNFRSGPIVLVKNAMSLQAPDFSPKPIDYLLYHASLKEAPYGTILNYKAWTKTENFVESENYDPLLPEEMNYTYFPTNSGITVKQRSMAFSFPGYDDFIIYDYTFVNDGQMVIEALNQVREYKQDFEEVWVAFHSGISVSTKGTLNFHYDNIFTNSAAPAGGFGGYHHPGDDVYTVQNLEADGKGHAYYSRDFNGGKSPLSWTRYAVKQDWQTLLRLRPEWQPELQDPACFGFAFLYRTPPTGAATPAEEADPSFFSVYNDENNSFQNLPLDFNENFGPSKIKNEVLYNFLRHNFQAANDGKIYAWYTSSFGPYRLAQGDSLRLIVAEVAGQLDMVDVVKGDPDGHFPDSSIAAIQRNIEAARNAIKWGFKEGSAISADVPDSPPPPICNAASASKGADSAIIIVTWDKRSELAKIRDASGGIFYDGSTDLSGYRIYRGIDGERRGAWELLADIPFAQAAEYWDSELNLYRFEDRDLQFGSEYYYYVQAYNSRPRTWTSANMTVVNNLPELASSDKNMTPIINAQPGPISVNGGWDVFVTPNPYIEGDPKFSFGEPNPRKIEFRNLPEKATIKIFNIAGEVVRTLEHGPDRLGNLAGSESWDQRTDEGLLVAPGLYIYVIQSATEGSIGSKTTGKFMIIR